MATVNPLLSLLATNPHPLLQPTSEHNAAALALAKLYLDPLAQSISDIQTARQQENRKKRKRGDREDADTRPLQLRRLHVEGFKVDQVHEQVKRVLEAAKKEVKLGLSSLESSHGINGANGAQADSEEEVSIDESLLEDEGFHTAEEDVDDGEDDQEVSDDDIDGLEADEDMENIEQDDEDLEDEDEDDHDGPASEFVEDRFGLNDGFFSIDDFNRQAEFLERADLNNQDDGAASDEEDVDWGADPMTSNPSQGLTSRKDDLSDEEDEDEDDEGGPTFGNMDLNAPEGFSDEEDNDEEVPEDADMDGMDDFGNANNIMYKDFFAPPARKASDKRGGKRGPPMKHNFPAPSKDDVEADMERTMAAVHRDLFSDEEEVEGEYDDDLSDVERGDPKARKSNHERRQAKILQEIRKLEAENVAKRQWTMSGEARGVDRPHNSLLEEDLDFERVGKPVPVITQEVSEDIESLIKRRILAREFDEVLRRQPDELLTGKMGRRGRIDEELQDSKSKQGLADLYEEDHLRKNDPNYVDKRDEKLKAAHREVENLWKTIADQLDSLCSWHYRPKPVEMNVQVRTDAPVVTMEDARPSGIGGDIAETSQLAPQEVYKAGADKSKSEVVTKGGEVVAREEMSREQKRSRRARAKERGKKNELNKSRDVPEVNGNVKSGKKTNVKTQKEKKALMGDLKKGGVMVIGRKGEVVDVEGKEAKRQNMSAGALRL